MIPPDFTLYAEAAAARIGADFARLDADGYLFRVSRGGRSALSGAGGVNAYPVNSATSVSIARDKAHAATVLSDVGLPVIPGRLFFAHGRRAGLRGPGREAGDAVRHAGEAGYPVFAKPNLGALGHLAEIIPDEAALRDWIARAALEFESFLIQPVIDGDEHRVLVKDGRAVFHAERTSAVLIGDGESTIIDMLTRANADLARTGISPWPDNLIAQIGRAPGDIPQRGERIALPGRTNLAALGAAERVSLDAPAPLAALAIAATKAIGLRIAAVDMFDVSPAHDLSQLLVIEVNGNPGLRLLELSGHGDVAIGLWADMLDEALEDCDVRT